MKKVVQNVRNGNTELIDIPIPTPTDGKVLIKSTRSLVSLGTEKMLVNFSKSNYLDKARQQPDKVKMVIDKIKTDGIMPTVNSVVSKLNEPMSLGYCNVGIVEAIGNDVKNFKKGDRVISNGAHAEYVSVSENLVHKIPNEVSDDDAVFTVIGAIALQGVRLCNPTLGETVVVYGLGLIGLITIQILKANGCNVIGIDLDNQKIRIAKDLGIDAINPNDTNEVDYVNNKTEGYGCDGVIITASAKSDVIISNAANMSRKRGRIILVGVIGLNISRNDFYEKELTFQVSCSYGPGRYDYLYEEKGIDYPLSFVRWTENRNFGAILNLILNNQISFKTLITEKKKFLNAKEVYENISSSKSIATIFVYETKTESVKKIKINKNYIDKDSENVGIIGAGGFTSNMILPMLKKHSFNIKYISSSNGLNSTRLAKQYKIGFSTTDNSEIFDDKEVDTVFITTRHNTHFKFVLEALKKNKNVFVEKPMCMNFEELDKIKKIYNKTNGKLLVGYNRRFAPFSKIIKEILVSENSPVNIVMNINAGFIPQDSWIQDMKVGGGRIIGEACHFIDLSIFFTGSLISDIVMSSMGKDKKDNTDNVSIILNHENGSNCSINYFSNGSKKYSKEKIDIYVNGKNIALDNWRKLNFYGFSNRRNISRSQDKGHYNQFRLVKNEINRTEIIPFDEIVNSTEATFGALQSLKEESWYKIS